MKRIFTNAIADQTSPIQTRKARGLASFLVDGILKVKEKSNLVGAAATVTIYDDFTGEQVAAVTVSQNQGLSSSVFKVPYTYTAEISGLVNSAIIDAGIDGDV